MRPITLMSSILFPLLLGLLIAEPAEASVKRCPSRTECRAVCGPLTETLTCATDRSRCTVECGGRAVEAECESGSGTLCVAHCESGTVSATCSQRSARCTGRCTPDDVPSSDPRSRWESAPLGRAGRPSADALATAFFGLSQDAWWAAGGDGPPSAAAESLLETLQDSGSFVSQGEFKGPFGDDVISIQLPGLPAEDLVLMLEAAEHWVETMLEDPARRRAYDDAVIRSVRSSSNRD